MPAGAAVGRCAALDRAVRLAIWNELKAGGVTDAGAMELVERIMQRFAAMAAPSAVGMILSLDREAAKYGLPHGLADYIDNHGQPCQSAALAEALALLRGAS